MLSIRLSLTIYCVKTKIIPQYIEFVNKKKPLYNCGLFETLPNQNELINFLFGSLVDLLLHPKLTSSFS